MRSTEDLKQFLSNPTWSEKFKQDAMKRANKGDDITFSHNNGFSILALFFIHNSKSENQEKINQLLRILEGKQNAQEGLDKTLLDLMRYYQSKSRALSSTRDGIIELVDRGANLPAETLSKLVYDGILTGETLQTQKLFTLQKIFKNTDYLNAALKHFMDNYKPADRYTVDLHNTAVMIYIKAGADIPVKFMVDILLKSNSNSEKKNIRDLLNKKRLSSSEADYFNQAMTYLRTNPFDDVRGNYTFQEFSDLALSFIQKGADIPAAFLVKLLVENKVNAVLYNRMYTDKIEKIMPLIKAPGHTAYLNTVLNEVMNLLIDKKSSFTDVYTAANYLIEAGASVPIPFLIMVLSENQKGNGRYKTEVKKLLNKEDVQQNTYLNEALHYLIAPQMPQKNVLSKEVNEIAMELILQGADDVPVSFFQFLVVEKEGDLYDKAIKKLLSSAKVCNDKNYLNTALNALIDRHFADPKKIPFESFKPLVRLLLEKGASVPTNPTLLISYMLNNTGDQNKKEIELLIAKEPSILTSKLGNETALEYFMNRHNEGRIMDRVFQSTIRLLPYDRFPELTEQKSAKGNTILHHCVTSMRSPEDHDFINKIVALNKNLVNVKNNDGFTPIAKLLLSQDDAPLQVVQSLASPENLKDKVASGHTLLNLACRWKNMEVFAYLYEQGPNFESANEQNRILLMNAISRDNKPLLDWLLEKKKININLNIENILDGQTPLSSAMSFNRPVMAQCLIKHGANYKFQPRHEADFIKFFKKYNIPYQDGALPVSHVIASPIRQQPQTNSAAPETEEPRILHVSPVSPPPISRPAALGRSSGTTSVTSARPPSRRPSAVITLPPLKPTARPENTIVSNAPSTPFKATKDSLFIPPAKPVVSPKLSIPEVKTDESTRSVEITEELIVTSIISEVETALPEEKNPPPKVIIENKNILVPPQGKPLDSIQQTVDKSEPLLPLEEIKEKENKPEPNESKVVVVVNPLSEPFSACHIELAKLTANYLFELRKQANEDETASKQTKAIWLQIEQINSLNDCLRQEGVTKDQQVRDFYNTLNSKEYKKISSYGKGGAYYFKNAMICVGILLTGILPWVLFNLWRYNSAKKESPVLKQNPFCFWSTPATQFIKACNTTVGQEAPREVLCP